MTPSFTLISFAYDEERLLEGQVCTWLRVLRQLTDDFEILLVNDGSSDATAEIADRLAAEYPELRVFHHANNQGVGCAFHTALPHATKDYVFWNDIDGHFDVNDLSKVLPLLVDPEVDIVVAFKHDNLKGKATQFSWLKSRVNYYLIKLLFLQPEKDFQFVQFFPRKFLQDRIAVESRSSFVPPECIIKARALGLSIRNIQLHYHSAPIDVHPSKCSDRWTIARSLSDIFSFWAGWVFLGGKRRAIRHDTPIVGADSRGLRG